jgi:hypothetical protein
MFEPIKIFEIDVLNADGSKGQLIGISSPYCLQMLSKSDDVVCDGTFRSAPRGFAQLYTIHGQISPFKKGNIECDDFVRARNCFRPMVHVFMTNKLQISYEKMLEALKEAVQKETGEQYNGPKRIIIDFELAIFNAFDHVSVT